MKKYPLILVTVFIGLIGYGQNLYEAYQLSSSELKGTARYTAMSGAFGALGGDISALKDNPAGSSIFLNNYLSGTLNAEFYKNNVGFNNYYNSSSEDDLDISQLGAVFVFNNYNSEATINKFALGLTYDKQKSLDDYYNWQGITNNSISNFFVNQANGIPLDLLVPIANESIYDLYQFLGEADFSGNNNYTNNQAQNAYLGYETFLVNSTDNTDFSNTEYVSNVQGNSFNQQYDYLTTGFNGKVSGNASLAINNKLHLGLNLNGHIINYEKNTIFYENAPASSNVNETYYENNVLTLGAGFSFDLGAIYKISDLVRLGVSYHSPQWYTIHDETTQYLETYGEQNGTVVFDPRVINIYPEYNYKTPSRLDGSLALVFGKSGIISFEYSHKDYSQIEYDSNNSYYNFNALNNAIDNTFTSSSTYKIGGEYRFKAWSFRGGYRLVESPYKNDKIASDLTGYSAGLGYSFGNINLGLSYYYSEQDSQQQFQQTSFNTPASIERKLSNVAATFSINL
ncbi:MULTISPECIES: OmpP1/FadL family transporter [Mesonia]|uniref:Uncharacterized protein n=1 Tax=Mesonia oceanica TaxID=2687242 RepID=A0AC61YDH2_9FLAO|nr:MULTISPECIES: outer membrane protein transport protein [Mesonia]MAN29496.1 hypothetical protein [Mesonia sp.]VVV02564.1 hypothetical protein FVB9532_03871 [Mesonia oceanica]|tara:strand:+ start:2846 stop:4381 length:1536 start_codon:yes stop_codon:yes gene_type:complete